MFCKHEADRSLASSSVSARGELPVVGVVGAGQLARMLHEAASALGLTFRVLAATPDDAAAPPLITGR
jgi:5-(carboxyamino)imidazole ribonucleotide synthase